MNVLLFLGLMFHTNASHDLMWFEAALDQGQHPTAQSALNSQLVLAVKGNDAKATRDLLLRGADPNFQYTEGPGLGFTEHPNKPVLFDANPRYLDVLRALLLAGVDPNVTWESMSFLEYICIPQVIGGNLPSDTDVVAAVRLLALAGARLQGLDLDKVYEPGGGIRPAVRAELARLQSVLQVRPPSP